jgi:hypothetical protein
MGAYNTLMGSLVLLLVLAAAARGLIDCLWPVKAEYEVR